jgi:putative heme transporter
VPRVVKLRTTRRWSSRIVATEPTPPSPVEDPQGSDGGPTPAATDGQSRLWQAGRTSWSVAGILVLVAVVGYLAALVPLVVVPVLLALFPATLLTPVQRFLERRGLPSALAAVVTILAGIVLVVGALALVTTLVIAELPELAESAREGIDQIEELLAEDPFGLGLTGVADIVDAVGEQMGEVGDIAPQAMGAAVVAFEFVAGLLIALVVLFFYLKDGRRLTEGVLSIVPARFRGRSRAIALRSWDTLGAYFRGQLLVALVDALVIGAGLLILGVPLAFPLAVLIFFGGLFPIVGAVATGALAVLVALADGGLTIGLIVLALVLAVQQLESNVLEPFILGRSIDLHPLMVLLAITAGGITLGILGAFLAVPVAAVIADAVDYLRSGEAPAPPPPDGGDARPDGSHARSHAPR